MESTRSRNSLSLDHGPWVRIAVNELSKRAGVYTGGSDITWHPSDDLKGHVVVSSAIDIVFDELQICFEGKRLL